MKRIIQPILIGMVMLVASCGSPPATESRTAVNTTAPPSETASPRDTPTAAVTDTPAITSTPTEPPLRSGSGTTAVTLKFVNRAASPVDVYWADNSGTETKYFTLSPGQSVEQGTYSTHAWRIRNLAGHIVLDVIATGDAKQTIEVTADMVSTIKLPPLPTAEAGLVLPEPVIGHAGCVITAPPASLKLDPFYAKYCDAGGIPIVASINVPDEAVGRAWNIITNLLAPDPELHQALAARGQYFGVLGKDEVTTDMPEYQDLKNDPVTNWDKRARGLGGFPFSSGAEENLMCYSNDPYRGESITLHEFAHTIDAGLDFVDPQFDKYLAVTYANAMEKGLWKNTYAATNQDEYWAEGVQSYFNTNLSASPPNGIHNDINTRAELKTYDPELFALIEYIFKGYDWYPTCDNL